MSNSLRRLAALAIFAVSCGSGFTPSPAVPERPHPNNSGAVDDLPECAESTETALGANCEPRCMPPTDLPVICMFAGAFVVVDNKKRAKHGLKPLGGGPGEVHYGKTLEPPSEQCPKPYYRVWQLAAPLAETRFTDLNQGAVTLQRSSVCTKRELLTGWFEAHPTLKYYVMVEILP